MRRPAGRGIPGSGRWPRCGALSSGLGGRLALGRGRRPGHRRGRMLHDDAHGCTLRMVAAWRNRREPRRRPVSGVAGRAAEIDAVTRRAYARIDPAGRRGRRYRASCGATRASCAPHRGRRRWPPSVRSLAGAASGARCRRDRARACPAAAGTRPRPAGAAASPDGWIPAARPARPSQDACSLADRMNALALATQERLRDARRAYDEHAGRRERAAAAADPRAVRAAKDEAQATFRRARLAAADRGASRSPPASGSARSTGSTPGPARRSACSPARTRPRAALLQAVERLGVEADGARIAAESAAEACRNARITLATCEERERAGAAAIAAAAARARSAPRAPSSRASVAGAA